MRLSSTDPMPRRKLFTCPDYTSQARWSSRNGSNNSMASWADQFADVSSFALSIGEDTRIRRDRP